MNLNYSWSNKKIQADFKHAQSYCQQVNFTNLRFALFMFFSFLLIFVGPAWNNPAWGQSSNSSAQNQQQAQPQQALKRNSAWAKPLQVDGADNFYQVNDWLYRSAQPDAEGFKNIEAMGIKTIINLRDTNKDPKIAVGTKLTLLNTPITTWSFDDSDILNALRAVSQAERPVLIHCRHGADRTGLIVALLRVINEGWSVEDAKQEMLKGGYGFHSIWKNIPEYLDNVDIEALKTKI